jgi:hypothetical protein
VVPFAPQPTPSIQPGARAQIPPPLQTIPNEPAEINACLSLQQAAAALSSDKDVKGQALTAANRKLADLDARLG